MLLRDCFSLMIVILSVPLAATALTAQEVSFNRDIRPILSNNCFACHGPDGGSRSTELRFDDEKIALAVLESGATAIVPGDLAKSDLFRRITAAVDHDDHMPPADFPKQLSPQQIELLRQWIAAGAKWEPHWAQVRPVRGEVPPAIADWRARGEIDRFIHARIQEDGQQPSPEADRRTLLRRVYFDLTGLPPTAEEVAAFVNDDSPDAYEKIVDHLLASPQFGERMAVWWLDLVRYADSIGYHSDTPRDVWMYRDWVIAALNDNKRFDEFTLEQLAGDLLPNSTSQNKIASGYNRLLQTTEEGGAQAKEYIAKYDADRVRNVSEVWLGATMGCAECHDHKYDPYTQADFYKFAAFFADINEPGVGKRQPKPMPSPAHEAKLKALDEQIAATEAALNLSTAEIEKGQAAWEATLREKLAKSTRSDLAWIDDERLPEGGQKVGDWKFVTKDHSPVLSGLVSREQTADGLVQHFVSGAKETITLGEGDMLFAFVYLSADRPPQQLMLQFNDGSWEHRAWWGEDKIPYGGNGTDAANHRKLGPLPKAGDWVRLEVSPEQVGLKVGSVINGFAFTQWGGTAYWDAAGVNRDGIGLPQNLVDVLNLESDKRTKEQVEALAGFYRANAPELAAARARLVELKQQKEALAKISSVSLVTETMAPRTIRILPRGNWLDDSGKSVEPNTPAFLQPLGVVGRRATRLDLARWLVDPQHPMTARAQVNRLWKLFYGYGIARTLNDMGGQGQWPTHPKLLDWLAVEFVESGWDLKHMVRLMVTSTTYRQTSKPSRELLAHDPYNKLFARQSRFRLEAEMVRDNALAISDLLVEHIGGPSVKPYQPAGYWMHLNFPAREWQNGTGDELYRRGLYTWWQRTFMYPSFLAFDATSREECTAERPRSNTPQQALVLLNDTVYVEAARIFAEQIARHEGDAAARLRFAFQTVLQRDPTTSEAEVLLKLHAKHLAEFQANPQAAAALASVGAKAPSADIDKPQQAAWTSVARVLLNLHETITRY